MPPWPTFPKHWLVVSVGKNESVFVMYLSQTLIISVGKNENVFMMDEQSPHGLL